MSSLRRHRHHSLWDLNSLQSKDPVEITADTFIPNEALSTPKRRFSMNNSNQLFHNLHFGHHDEMGLAKVGIMERSESSEAEFISSGAGSDSEEDSTRLPGEYAWVKAMLCPDANNDLFDFTTFSSAFESLSGNLFYTQQLAAVFKHISPDKQPIPFSQFRAFLMNPCDDTLVEFHRKQMYHSILKAYKISLSPQQNEEDEAESSHHDSFEDDSIETLRKRCKEQQTKIQSLEVELENERNEKAHVSIRCKHLETKITLLEDGEKLHTHVFLLKAMIRSGEDVKSKRIRIMPEGATVRVAEIRANRARLDFPVKGWCSIFARDGRLILQSLDPENKMPNSNPDIKRGDSESVELNGSINRSLLRNRSLVASPSSQLSENNQENRDNALLERVHALELELEELKSQKISLVINTAKEIDRLSDLCVE